MRNLLHLLWMLVVGIGWCACQPGGGLPAVVSQPLRPDTILLHEAYEQYHEPSIRHRRFKHETIQKLLLAHRDAGRLNVQEAGKSALGKSIYHVQFGSGPRSVLLWSQMHGDEPTATMALMDLFNFLSGSGDEQDSIRQLIREQTTLHFLPMLNPDGADRYTRRNAFSIDLNRDARAAQTPEAQLLIRLGDSLRPDYGFNLHDQNIYYNVPGTPTPVTISLLAPAYDEEKTINEVRGRAMKLVIGMHRLLQEVIPGAVTRYDDTHSPRGFGDNFQKWGTSTVLIEAGGYRGDSEKQFVRKVYFMALLNAIIEIAQANYDRHLIHEYEQIPVNDQKLFDLLLRGVRIPLNDSVNYVTDLGINRGEYTVDTAYYVRSRIADIGDLEAYFGYDEVDSTGLELVRGCVHPQTFRDINQLGDSVVLQLLRQGVAAVKLATLPPDSARMHGIPLVIFHQQHPNLSSLGLGAEANFFLRQADTLRYAVINGYLIDLRDGSRLHSNAMKGRIRP